MKTALIICVIIHAILFPGETYAQYSETEICTDSSEISIDASETHLYTREKIYSMNKTKIRDYYLPDSSLHKDSWERFLGESYRQRACLFKREQAALYDRS